MRHLRSILYALVLAPAAWILCGVGFDQDLTGRARDNGGVESLSGVLLLLLAGAAYAILLFAPISPLGPLTAGLAFLAIGAWARVAPSAYADAWPAKVASDGFDLSTPGYGLAVLLAVPMLCTALSERRWAGYEPPRIPFVGTLGRPRGAAVVAGTTMASEQTTVIPQQRQAPEIESLSAGTTQIVGPTRPDLTPPTHDLTTTATTGDEATRDVPVGEATLDVPIEEVTREVDRDRTVASTSGEQTTRLTTAGGAETQEVGGELTQLLSSPQTDGRGEQTQVIRSGAAEGDRTQVLAGAVPGEAVTVPTAGLETARVEETTRAMSIVAAERPDPAEDPTTRLPSPTAGPGESTTRAQNDRPAMTATNLEHPDDEAGDATRRL